MNNKRPQYTKSKFKMFSSCFIFYDNTETLSFRLWFPAMPLLVLWLNIDFSIGAETVLNLGSSLQAPCKIAALVWSWTAVAGVASCPCAAWRDGKGSRSSCVNLRSNETAVQVLSLKRKRRRHACLLEQRTRQQSKSIQKEILHILINLQRSQTAVWTAKHINCFSWSAKARVRSQYNTGPYYLPPKHPAHCQCNSPITDHSWNPLLACLKTAWCFNAIQVMLQWTT